MKRKVIQIGNSLGVTIPAEVVEQQKLKKGSQIEVGFGENQVEGVSDQKSTYSVNGARDISNTDFMKSLDRVNKRYNKAFKELANK